MPPPPLNAPAGQQATGGVQPGQSNAVVFANKVIVFGTSDGLFVYSGAPGPGTLLASVTTATKDPFGNTTQPGGFVIYLGSAYTEIHVGSAFGSPIPSLDMVTGVASESEHAQLFAFPNNTALVNELVGTWLLGAGSSHDNIQAAVNLISAAANGSQAAAGVLGFVTSGGLTEKAFWDSTGFQALGPGGSPGWYCNGTQTDASTNTNANVVAATKISVAWTYPAKDANVGTIYEIEVPWDATMEGNTLELGLSIDAAAGFTNNVTFSGAIVGAGVGLNGTIRVKVQVTALGSGTTGKINVFVDGTVIQNGAAATFTNSTGFANGGRAKTVSFDTTVSHTFQVNSLWGASTAAQTVSGYGSTFTRKGQ